MSDVRKRRGDMWPQDMVYRRISAPGDDQPLPLPLPLLEVMEDWLQAQRFSAAPLAAPAQPPAEETARQWAAELRVQLAEIRRSRAEGRRGKGRKR